MANRKIGGDEVGFLQMHHGIILGFLMAVSSLSARPLAYAPAPVDNPLKGLVPYAGEPDKDRFPHSMEFRYFAFSDLMKGWGKFDWTVLENQLEEAGKRGKQNVVRVYLEYPGKEKGIPGFLIEEGLQVTAWMESGKEVRTPDYRSPVLRRALKEFISAFGNKYDGDPRLGFVTAGLLGLWGEWHNYPRSDLMAGKEVQLEVMKAFEASFRTTFVLHRYPAGRGDVHYADNSRFRLGYHDDSFAWATLETGRKEDGWFFVPSMKRAGVMEKWKEVPIGGEIRPEIWATTFTGRTTGQEQDFERCVRETHASWLMDTGVFSKRYPMDEARKKRAMKEVGKMGYELHLPEVRLEKGELVVLVENRGVAPFYYDWPVEIRAGEVIRTDWKLSEVLPGKPTEWRLQIKESDNMAIRIPNPMKGGISLKFANAGYEGDWLPLISRSAK